MMLFLFLNFEKKSIQSIKNKSKDFGYRPPLRKVSFLYIFLTFVKQTRIFYRSVIPLGSKRVEIF